MKAPDKICLETYLDNPDKLHPSWYRYDIIGGGIEYIRKDALLEWAKENQYKSLTIVADNFWQEVIDKINSL